MCDNFKDFTEDEIFGVNDGMKTSDANISIYVYYYPDCFFRIPMDSLEPLLDRNRIVLDGNLYYTDFNNIRWIERWCKLRYPDFKIEFKS